MLGGLYYLPRMIDKMLLHAAGQLPPEYERNLGRGFDGRCAAFLGIAYTALQERVLQGGSDEEFLEWTHAHGHRPTEEEIHVWNEFMRKVGWNDEATPSLSRRLAEDGLHNRPDIQTIFDYIDLDEGRDPAERRRNGHR